MTRLPSLKPRQIVSALDTGSHYQLFNERTRRHTTVPYHTRDLPRGTVAAIVRQAGVTREGFLRHA